MKTEKTKEDRKKLLLNGLAHVEQSHECALLVHVVGDIWGLPKTTTPHEKQLLTGLEANASIVRLRRWTSDMPQ
jgi:hypothetical protein